MLYILLAMFSASTFQGCKKEQNSPMTGLHSSTEFIAGTWKAEKYTIDGEDYTSSISGYTETYSKEGNYHYSLGSIAEINNWFFKNNNKEVSITGISNNLSNTLYILKLEVNEFWYYYMDGNDRKELHLIQQ